MRKRLLFYVRKGNGLGHLKRLSRIAGALSENYSCLFISGHREMSWMIPSDCEYYQIPFCDNIDRSQLIMHVNEMYCPDAIFFDHSLNGNDGDIHPLLDNSKARKFLILRGVLDSPEKSESIYHTPSSLFYMNNKIDHIFVACDERIEDISTYRFLEKGTLGRTSYIGYVAPAFPDNEMTAYRNSKRKGKSRYVVSNPGGGFKNHALLKASMELASEYAGNTRWDILYGPKNDRRNPFYPYDTLYTGNTGIHISSPETDWMNASSDILITRGGYNNLIEGIYGSSHIICQPMGPKNDEQFIHAKRLSHFYDKLKIVGNTGELKECFYEVMRTQPPEPPYPNRCLNLNGIENLVTQLNNLI